MTVSLLKTHFRKLPPKVVTYRDFKKFENEKFMDSLKLSLNRQDADYIKNPQFKNNFLNYAGMNLNIMLQEKKSTSVKTINL